MMIETPQVARLCQDRQSIDRANAGDSCQQFVIRIVFEHLNCPCFDQIALGYKGSVPA